VDTRESRLSVLQGFLSLAWAYSFLTYLTPEMFARCQVEIRRTSRQLDSMTGPRLRKEELRSCAEIHTRQGLQPSLHMRLRGISIVYKPADWEVDGEADDGNHAPLSVFTQSVFSQTDHPIVHDVRQNYGFLHRLDVPSSGLILVGTTFEGYHFMRLQLDTQRLQREYVVLCRGLGSPALVRISARVDTAPDPSQRKSITDRGKPSETLLQVTSHAKGIKEGYVCLAVHQIRTGRRHQIRAHMRFANLPSVSDGRYTLREILFRQPICSSPAWMCCSSLVNGEVTESTVRP